MGFHQLTLVTKFRRYQFFEFIHEIRYLLDILHTHTAMIESLATNLSILETVINPRKLISTNIIKNTVNDAYQNITVNQFDFIFAYSFF